MAFLTGLLLIALCSLDWAKNCKAVNYKFKQYGAQKYGFGCKKGCFGFYNGTDDNIDGNGTKAVGDHFEQANCVECKTITKAFLNENFAKGNGEDYTDEEFEIACNDYDTCFWNSKKKTCGAGSCPHMAAYENCGTEWKNGKCEKTKDADCTVTSFRDYESPNPNQASSQVYHCNNNTQVSEGIQCSKLADYCYRSVNVDSLLQPIFVKFSSDNSKECKYYCDHPQQITFFTTYEYTKAARKRCNKVYGCIFSPSERFPCSSVAVWAFIVILVIAILVVIAIIALIAFLIYKLCGNKTSQVNPDNSKNASQSAAVEDGTTSDKAIHDQPVEGPYVVIKMGDKQLSTKIVAKAPVLVWGETVVFDSLGNEDEDATFELHGTDSDGTHTLRILDYVNNKQRVPLTLKNSAGADVGVLEVDIEIKAQEEPVKVSGIFFVDKYGPGSVVPKE